MKFQWQNPLVQLLNPHPSVALAEALGLLGRIFLGAFIVTTFSGYCSLWAADAVSISSSAPFRYVGYASGLIDSANLTLRTTSTLDCIAKCIEKLVCSAVSISHRITPGPDGLPSFECRIAVGDFTWTPNANYLLLMEDIGSLNGYKLAADGKFYKYVNLPDGGQLRQARTACIQDGGNLGVPYPLHVRQSILNAVGALPWNYFIGFTSRKAYFGGDGDLWLMDTGLIFNSSNQTMDPNQSWKSAEPSGSGPNVVVTPIGTWNDVNQNTNATSLCVRFNYYTKSPNSKYHKVYYTKSNMADAAAVCASDGGTLANVYGVDNYKGVSGYRMQLISVNIDTADPPFLLVGGTDAAVEGTWIMPDGSVMDVATKGTDTNQKWTTSALNGSMATNDCLVLTASGFQDAPCTQSLRFLCEILA